MGHSGLFTYSSVRAATVLITDTTNVPLKQKYYGQGRHDASYPRLHVTVGTGRYRSKVVADKVAEHKQL
uniref:Transposase n=1 Tax=Steinernema glaseri TaxID=37863 RepID=A0A1I8AT87_9BILA